MIWTYMGPDQAESLPPLPNPRMESGAGGAGAHLACACRSATGCRRSRARSTPRTRRCCTGASTRRAPPAPGSRSATCGRPSKCIKQDFGMSIAARRNYDANTLYWRVNQFMLPFYTLVPPLSPFPDLSGHAWVPIDDENTLCIMFSYHPSKPLLEKTRQVFAEDHKGRESGHASRHALVEHPVTVPLCRLLDQIQSAERLPVRLRGAADHLVLGPAGALGAGRCLSERRLADLRPHQGDALLERYRHRDDAALHS